MSKTILFSPLAKNLGLRVDGKLNAMSPEDLIRIAVKSIENLVVLIPGQSLSVEEQDRICRTMGTVEEIPQEIWHRCPEDQFGNVVNSIQRVTGAKDQSGKPKGLFYHNETLDWHVNRASAFHDRKGLVWLSAESGVEGSKTSWCNMEKAFSDLSEGFQQELREMSGYYGYRAGAYSPVIDFKDHKSEEPHPIVVKNRVSGAEALYFPFHQILGIEGLDEESFQSLKQRIYEHCTQEKYLYHHEWRVGDVIISDQWSTLHKRWSCDVSRRLLFRVTFEPRI